MSESNKKIYEGIFERPEERFLNREHSWLKFNERVYELALRSDIPLLERFKFLGISSQNLDEFFMVRIGGLKYQIANRQQKLSHDGLLPEDLLRSLYREMGNLIAKQQQTYLDLKTELQDMGIAIVRHEDLKPEELLYIENYYNENIFPTLTPFAIDPLHPFPQLPNLTMNYIFEVEKKDRERSFVIMPLPAILPRFIEIPAGEVKKFIPLEEIAELFRSTILQGKNILSQTLISIVRKSDIEISDEAEDLVRHFESQLKLRRKSDIVAVKCSKSLGDLPLGIQEFIEKNLEISLTDMFVESEFLNLRGINFLYDIVRPDLKYPHFEVRFPERILEFGGDCFAAISHKDIIVHHPYESYEVVVKFLQQAAKDPNVVSIKQTLYRTNQDSAIVEALIDAAENGKAVTVVVELKARFDEEQNLKWGRNLEEAGAQVVYGLPKVKTHCKLSMVTRKEEKGLRNYLHIATGNYNEATAKIYGDLSFFTCDPKIASDISLCFNYLTGYSEPTKFNKISISPINLREATYRLIDDEIEYAKNGQCGNFWAKLNSLTDREMIDRLYFASQNGVKIHLFIRGICCLRPGIKDLSENIIVKSMVGRFLEHSRILCFGAGNKLPSANAKVFISSADWMYRNLDRRVEIMVPIENPTVHEQIMNHVMLANMLDKYSTAILDSYGNYHNISTRDAKIQFSAHNYFINNPSLSGRGSSLIRSKIEILKFEN